MSDYCQRLLPSTARSLSDQISSSNLRTAARCNSDILNGDTEDELFVWFVSQSYRCRSGRFFSVSTEDSSVDSEVGSNTTLTSGRSSAGAAGLKTSKQRWSGFFTNTKGTKLDLLTAQLDDYDKHGVPKLSELSYELTFNEDGEQFLDQ